MAYIIKVTLEDTHPPVWRRILVPDAISFQDLHEILQTAFGWDDYHMHNFTFPSRNIEITQKGEEGYGNSVEEDKAVIDDFMKECKWIRYTYDFGDDWCHKIVLEKTDMEYQGRSATVLKAKGDNFEEDSGGIWGGEGDNRSPFYIEEVNAKLQKQKISKKKSSKQALDLIQIMKDLDSLKSSKKQFRKDLKDMLQEYLDSCEETIENVKAAFFDKDKSKRIQMLIQLHEYAWMEMVNQRTENFRISINFHEPVKSMKDMLLDFSETELADYGQCLQIEFGEKTTEQRAETIVEAFAENPKYLLYIFTEEEFALLKKLFAIPYRRSYEIERDDLDVLSKGIVTGVLDVETSNRLQNKTMRIRFASDAAGLIEKNTADEIEKFYKEHSQIFENLSSLLMTYSMLEVKTIGELYAETFGQKLEAAELRSCIYLRICLAKGARLITEEDTKSVYLAVPELDTEEILSEIKEYDVTVPYKKFRKKELLSSAMGFVDRYPMWREFVAYMEEGYDITEEEKNVLNARTFMSVQNGASVTEIRLDIEQEFEFDNVVLKTEFWELLTDICLNTPIPALKGYSRAEYSKLTGRKPWELGLYDPDVLGEDLEENWLYGISLDQQYELYRIMKKDKNSALDVKAVKKIVDDATVELVELKYMLAVAYLKNEDMNKAERLLTELYRETKDEGIEEVLSMLHEVKQQVGLEYGWQSYSGRESRSEWDKPMGEVVPFRREKEKIGRNAPCPCGSGKKFKQCCMGKGIYD